MNPASEKELLEWLASRPSTQGLLGDDAAILNVAGETCVTVDCQIAGTHVGDLEPAQFARRLLAINLSDIASMGARPRYAFLALAAPPDYAFVAFFNGFLEEADDWGVTLAGGDLSRADRPTASLTLIGERWPGSEWLKRSSAKAGEAVWIGGNLGEAALGWRLGNPDSSLHARIPSSLHGTAQQCIERHRNPLPQVELGRWLSGQPAACTDVSDGLARDLRNLCEASAVGAVLEERLIPSAPGYRDLAARLGLDPLGLQLGGGEDYVLLFTLPTGVEVPADLGCHRIGRTRSGTLALLRSSGEEEPLADLGWDHLRDIP